VEWIDLAAGRDFGKAEESVSNEDASTASEILRRSALQGVIPTIKIFLVQ
jgi:hypothetical protein